MDVKKTIAGAVGTLAIFLGAGQGNASVGLAIEALNPDKANDNLDTNIIINAKNEPSSAYYVPFVAMAVKQGDKIVDATVSMKSFNELMPEFFEMGTTGKERDLIFNGSNEQKTFAGNLLEKTMKLDNMLHNWQFTDIKERFDTVMSDASMTFMELASDALRDITELKDSGMSDLTIKEFAYKAKANIEKELNPYVKELTEIVNDTIQYQKDMGMPTLAKEIDALTKVVKEKFPQVDISVVKDVMGGKLLFDTTIKQLAENSPDMKITPDKMMKLFNVQGKSIDEKLQEWYQKLSAKENTMQETKVSQANLYDNYFQQ